MQLYEVNGLLFRLLASSFVFRVNERAIALVDALAAWGIFACSRHRLRRLHCARVKQEAFHRGLIQDTSAVFALFPLPLPSAPSNPPQKSFTAATLLVPTTYFLPH